jgi:hypothetical protein
VCSFFIISRQMTVQSTILPIAVPCRKTGPQILWITMNKNVFTVIHKA